MAGRFSDADKERVRDANRIEVVIGEYVALRPAGGGNLKGLCPFHEEKSPSFHVRPAHGTYHCFGCGEGGDVFSFVAAIDHLTFIEAVQRLADRAGITLTMVEGGGSGPRGGREPVPAGGREQGRGRVLRRPADHRGGRTGPGVPGRSGASTWPPPRTSAAGSPRPAGTS